MPTKMLNAACLQFNGPAPVSAANMLGKAGLTAPAAAAAALTRSVGR